MSNEAYVQELYEKYKDSFDGFFHSVLWKIIMDGMTAGELATFTVNQNRADGPLQLVVAVASGGYLNTAATFKATSYAEAMKVAEALSAEVFGYSAECARKIMIQSFINKCEA